MKPLLIESTSGTPKVKFDQQKGVLQIKGKSIPADPLKFYRPVLEWLDEYAQNPQEHTQMNICFEYMNTSSSKWLFDLFRKMKEINDAGHKVTINWYYEEDDEDMLETGEDFQDIIDLPINLIEIED